MKGLGLRVSNELGGALSHQQAPTQTYTHTYIHTHLPLSPPTPSRPTKNKHVPTDLTDLPVSEWQRVKIHTDTHTHKLLQLLGSTHMAVAQDMPCSSSYSICR